MDVELRALTSLEQVRAVWPVMRELRPHLSETEYLELFQASQAEGYRLVGAFEGEQCLGLIGHRLLIDFVHGRHVYVDDLVVTEQTRSQGVGAKLLKHAEDVAREMGLSRLRLCTGTDNVRGQDFYVRNGWEMRAVVYKRKV